MKRAARSNRIRYQGNGSVVVALWKDSKPVFVASHHVGVSPTVSKRRYSMLTSKLLYDDLLIQQDNGWCRPIKGLLDRFSEVQQMPSQEVFHSFSYPGVCHL